MLGLLAFSSLHALTLAVLVFTKGELMWGWLMPALVTFLFYIAARRARKTISSEALQQDLDAWAQVLGPCPGGNALFYSSDVVKYYHCTTERDYRWLRWFIGPGMHTLLTAPSPVRMQGMGTRQAMFVMAELCSIKGRRVLEIGCGRGHCTLLLAALMPEVQFEGIDLLEEHIRAARTDARVTGARNVKFAVGDAEKWEHVVGTYDIIFGVESLCYIRNVPQFLRRLRGHLRPGGRLVMVDGFRSATFATCSREQRMAMRHAEQGFCINAMQTKAHWCRWAMFNGLHVIGDRDLTTEAIPFWTTGWWWTRWLLLFPNLLRHYIESSDDRRATGGNLCAITMVAHALHDRGAAEYGTLVIQR